MTNYSRVWTYCFLSVAATAGAQSPPLTPAPRILQIFREQVALGHEADYLHIETETVATQLRLNFQHAYLALQGVNFSGDVWYLSGYDTYADVDQVRRNVAANSALASALDQVAAEKADLVLDPHTVFARHRQDLSYGRGLSGQRSRYFVVTTIWVLPGHIQDFAEIRRMIHAAHERAGSGEIHSVYQVESGMPDGTFLIFTPVATLDEAGFSRDFDQNGFDTALDAAARTRLRDLSTVAIRQSETSILAIRPEISLPAKEWLDADPGLWKPAPP